MPTPSDDLHKQARELHVLGCLTYCWQTKASSTGRKEMLVVRRGNAVIGPFPCPREGVVVLLDV